MKTGFITQHQPVNKRTRLSEFSLLLAKLDVKAQQFYFRSLEAHGNYHTDIKSIRTVATRGEGRREERVVDAHLPSFKNYFPESFFVELLEESDTLAGRFEDRFLEFWSAFDTTTYRNWIDIYTLQLRMLFVVSDEETENLYWQRLGGDMPSLPPEERRFLLLLRFFGPFLRGRSLLFDRIIPAFTGKPTHVEEFVPAQTEIPEQLQWSLGKKNSRLGRDIFPGRQFTQNSTRFRVVLEQLDEEDIPDFIPHGKRRVLLENLSRLFAPAHQDSQLEYRFKAGLQLFTPGTQHQTAYLGLSTYLRETF